jgi:exopolysaccharide biosynthesis polyprenyl glycosylphosphotransferase
MSGQLLHVLPRSREHSALDQRHIQWRLLTVALLIGDALSVTLGFVVAYMLRFWTGWDIFEQVETRLGFYSAVIAALVPCWVLIFALYGLYNRRHLLSGPPEYARIFNSCLLGVLVVVVVSFLIPGFVVARAWLLLSWACVLAFCIGWRFWMRRVVYGLRSYGYLTERMLVLGANAEGQAIAAQLCDWPSCGARVVGFIDESTPTGSAVLPGMPVLGPASAFPTVVLEHDIDTVIIADTAVVRERLPLIYGAMETLQQLDVRLAPGLFELLTTGVQVREQGSVPLLLLNKNRITGPHAFCKALIDRLGALVGLLLLGPVFLAIMIAIKRDDGGPIFHRRRVVGVGKRPFDAFKFRTMHVDAAGLLSPAQQEELAREGKLKHDPRITRVGRFLRKTSLDELPQLINVVLGQMSLVGPRMLTADELAHCGRWQHNLLTVRPGLTGLWQISGRSDLGYEDRVRLDMHYIRNYSLWLDLYIIFRTIPIVVTGHGAY